MNLIKIVKVKEDSTVEIGTGLFGLPENNMLEYTIEQLIMGGYELYETLPWCGVIIFRKLEESETLKTESGNKDSVKIPLCTQETYCHYQTEYDGEDSEKEILICTRQYLEGDAICSRLKVAEI